MKILITISLFFVGLVGNVTAKPYIFPNDHFQVVISDSWNDVTKSDELVSVKNANGDSFTITVIPVDHKLDVQTSNLREKVKANFVKKGFEMIRDESFQFQGIPAVAVVAKATNLGVSFFIYNILLNEGNDVLSITMVGDNDPSADPQFKAILDTFTPIPPQSEVPAGASSTMPSK